MDPVEAFLNRLQHPLMAGIDLSLDRMVRLLALIGSPQKRLPPIIHVAGTNGKGSLIAYLHAIFEAAGYRVHRYSSPHLVEFRERIVLQGHMIENGHMEKIMRHMVPALAQQPVTFFEATTSAAFLAFSEVPADILLLETGMGGRLDSTNVIDKPVLTAITPISYDHMEYLGGTLEKIASEKAGIIKRNVPCVVGRQEQAALCVLESKAQQLAAPLSQMGRDWYVEDGQYRSEKYHLALKPGLMGEHQLDNAATAVACIEQLPQFNITQQHIEQGLANVQWPARLQPLHDHPYTKYFTVGVELILDGSHNPQGGETLAKWFAGKRAERKIYAVCGMLKGKDCKNFLKHLTPYLEELVAVTIPKDPNALPADAIAQAAQELGMGASVAPTIENALQSLAERVKTPAIICICGSLYLAGKVLAVK
jgi:dihydrofolate synthase / folylpolyglutamate synthase